MSNLDITVPLITLNVLRSAAACHADSLADYIDKFGPNVNMQAEIEFVTTALLTAHGAVLDAQEAQA